MKINGAFAGKKVLKNIFQYKKSLSAIVIASLLFFGAFLYFSKSPKISELQKMGVAGEHVLADFSRQVILPIKETDDKYQVTDTLNSGVLIEYANLTDEQKKEEEFMPENELNIEFPKNYAEPINIKLDEQRTVQITNKNGEKFSDKLITEEIPLVMKKHVLSDKMAIKEDNFAEAGYLDEQVAGQFESKVESEEAETISQSVAYLKYQDKAKRVSTYYAYQKNNKERRLKSWTIYNKAAENQTEERESYVITNAKLKLNEAGEVEVFYFGEKELQNEQVKSEVAPSLMERAQRTLQKELGEDILNSDNQSPDFVIPVPYYLNKNAEKVYLLWEIDSEENSITTKFTPRNEDYPIALDPTLEFTAPGQGDSSSTISMNVPNKRIGEALVSGDFNADGRVDLAISSPSYKENTGRVYIFYNDGSMPNTAAMADVIITGEGVGYFFGSSIVSGDFNQDGKTDLVVGSRGYLSDTGRVYIFYNDGSIPTLAGEADVIIVGEGTGNNFGSAMTVGDFDADGTSDLVVGAPNYLPTGRVYIFHNDGSIPVTAAAADRIIAGEEISARFGSSMVSGDFDHDGTIDLAVGDSYYSSNTGRAYIFYNDGSIPTTAAMADVIINGEATNNYFGIAFTAGDFNHDGRIDLAIGASYYSSYTGRAYVFYNDGSIPTTAAMADVIITGQATNSGFGYAMTSGDFNHDGRTDLAVGAYRFPSTAGRVFIFYNDGSIPTTASSADIIISGESNGGLVSDTFFGASLVSGDFNTNGRIDLVVGSPAYAGDLGRVYVFHNDGSIPTAASSADVRITGETDTNFGFSMTSGDFNHDGKMDLAIGAPGYLDFTGRVYIFYSEISTPATTAAANVIITGQGFDSGFGSAMTSGDFNHNGRTDLAVGANLYSSYTGRAYIFYNDGSIPTAASSADRIISGESGSHFGTSMTSGDFNHDGRVDLAVGAIGYSGLGGRAYIFHNDGSIPTTAATADVIITREGTYNHFGTSMTSGDFNHDGRTDLAVGAERYSSYTGRAYIFYNDGSIPTTAAAADVIITGEATNGAFGHAMTAGDFNHDGKTDLAITADRYFSSSGGRVYIFHNDGAIPNAAADADIIITEGVVGVNYFGASLISGDFNADGRTDLAVGARSCASSAGRAYIFYNDGDIPNTGVEADVIITGEEVNSHFGYSMAVGDFDHDGAIDLAVGAERYSSYTGRAYIFYSRKGQIAIQNSTSGEHRNTYIGNSMISGDFNHDGKTDLVTTVSSYLSNTGRAYIFYNNTSFASNASTADVIITGEGTSNNFGYSVTSGDVNADGKEDLIIGAPSHTSNTGRAYVFYNDGSLPADAAMADVIITGEGTANLFGYSMTTGDFNTDGKIDLVVGAYGYMSSTGRSYIFNNNDGINTTSAAMADTIITGEGTSNQFGASMISGDFNHDGRVDLAVGAIQYLSSTGRAYIFYNDGSIPTTADMADVIITGETTNNRFGHSLSSGDFNANGRVDLAVSAYSYSSNTGRAYIFYNDGVFPTAADAADVIITGEASSRFGSSMASGDFNADGTIDLAVSATYYSVYTGRAYIFYNDGAFPITADMADVVITGENNYDWFGTSIVSGDFNSNGKTDLAIGSYGYASNAGCAYIFYNDGVIPALASEANVKITGDITANLFGSSIISGDFNGDGAVDLVVGARGYAANTGKLYVFYNNSAFPNDSELADVVIKGENENDFFSSSFASADINDDGIIDLIVTAPGNNNNTGKVYVFDSTGVYPTSAAAADMFIVGENENDFFGHAITTGSVNSANKFDLIVGAKGYNLDTGRVYIFKNDGTIPNVSIEADNIITGENANDYFGSSLMTGDFDSDSDEDLVVGAYGHSADAGRVYIFNNNNNGAYPVTATDADVKIDGEKKGHEFGYSLIGGDFNNNGKTDLVVSAIGWTSSYTGKVYIFYNDGALPNLASLADHSIAGEEAFNYFGHSLSSADFNNDGRTDLAVGAWGFGGNKGKVYVFKNGAGYPSFSSDATVRLGGSGGSGFALAVGDFNLNHRMELVIGGNNLFGAGSFQVYEMDAEGTKPNYIELNGGVRFDGNVLLQ